MSAGFSETGPEGKKIEDEIVALVNSANGTLIGPNCIGVLTHNYQGVFTEPIPKLDVKGCDLISGSGATVCFILESAISTGLTFANIFSVGNSGQTGVEDVLKYLDETFEPDKSSPVKLLYIETINKPAVLFKHALSLIRKGCKIAVIKSGVSESGSRAATSHTGALASSDVAVDALFRKAGIVRCHSREELVTVASVFMHRELMGKNIAVVTHAGGPAVMLTDILTKCGMQVPRIEIEYSKPLLDLLYPGASVSNPIDFLATGTAEQLGTIVDFVEKKCDEVDGIVVIFGTPGLVDISDVYEMLHEKMKVAIKPIFPVLPSIITAKKEVKNFILKGHINFPDEVVFGKALAKVYNTQMPADESIILPEVDDLKIRGVIDGTDDGYILIDDVHKLLDSANIDRVYGKIVSSVESALKSARKSGYPIVMKAVGPTHKSDVGGVVLNVTSDEQLSQEFERLMKIKNTTSVLIQKMISGMELFAGVKYEERFGHLLFCGTGGIFVEVLKDVKFGLAPLGKKEVLNMIRSLKSYQIIKGIRGQKGANEEKFAEIMIKLSALINAAPEIVAEVHTLKCRKAS